MAGGASGQAILNRVRQLHDMLQPSRLTRIVDIGANPANVPDYRALLQAGLCDVWGFEPQPKQFQMLVENPGPHEHYLPYAIGDGEAHTLNICVSDGFTSLLTPSQESIKLLGRWKRAMRVRETIELETHRLDDLVDLPEFDFLKIDIQGGETMVFEHGKTKISKALAVMTEVAFVPLYVGQPLLDDQMSLLRKFGFDLHKFMFLKSKSINTPTDTVGGKNITGSQLVDGDAVFVKDLLDLDDHEDEALKHLAILAAAVFGSFDLEFRVLAILRDRGAISASGLAGYAKTVQPAV